MGDCENYITYDKKCRWSYNKIHVCTNHYVYMCGSCKHKKNT